MPTNQRPNINSFSDRDSVLGEFLSRMMGNYLYKPTPQVIQDTLSVADSAVEFLSHSIREKKRMPDFRPTSWAQLLDIMQTDVTLEACLYYRIQRLLFLSNPSHPSLGLLSNFSRLRTGSEIYYSTEIGPGLNIQHGTGVVIGPRMNIGARFTIHQGATLGQRRLNSPNETITVGDDVTVFVGAVILGGVTVGDNVQVGANAVLHRDAQPNSVYAGLPAIKVRSLPKREDAA